MITTTDLIKNQGLKLLVGGVSGAGKTYLLGTTPDPENTLIISNEGGLLSLAGLPAMDVEPVSSLRDLQQVFAKLSRQQYDKKYSWVCLDSISEIAEVVLAQAKKDNRDGRAAYGAAAEQIDGLVRAFRDLPCNIVMTCKLLFSKGKYRFGMPSESMSGKIPFFFDVVGVLHADRQEDGTLDRYLQTVLDQHNYAKCRAGFLDAAEVPSLSIINEKFNKLFEVE